MDDFAYTKEVLPSGNTSIGRVKPFQSSLEDGG